MRQGLDRLADTAGRMADKAAKVTTSMMEKGKDRVEVFQLQQRLSKAQKQLGALVYMLRKTGQENAPMIEHYVQEIDDLKAQIDFLQPSAAEGEVHVYTCPSCGAEGMEDAMFCRRCGAKLPD